MLCILDVHLCWAAFEELELNCYSLFKEPYYVLYAHEMVG